MNTHLLRCTRCGSSNLRRSRRQTATEGLRMALGRYPFRCIDCGARQQSSIWLFSKLGTAKCPKCLSTELLLWPEKYFRLSALRNLLLTFGAHPYRCPACRFNFLSFRHRKLEQSSESLQKPPEVLAD